MRPGDWAACRRLPLTRRSGFTYVWMLAALVLISIGLAAIGERWADQAKREREQELLRIGSLYAKAIASYYAASPGSVRKYPPQLENLTEDSRMLVLVRHIRKLYSDPIDPSRSWGVVRAPDGGVLGVYSQSEESPLRVTPVDIGLGTLPAASRYSDWKFIPVIEQPAAAK